MKILIEIPKEFECDYNKDKFKDCFTRIVYDIENFMFDKNIINLAGNYEKETCEMFIKAFQESEKQ